MSKQFVVRHHIVRCFNFSFQQGALPNCLLTCFLGAGGLDRFRSQDVCLDLESWMVGICMKYHELVLFAIHFFANECPSVWQFGCDIQYIRGKHWISVSRGHFIKHKHLIPEVWPVDKSLRFLHIRGLQIESTYYCIGAHITPGIPVVSKSNTYFFHVMSIIMYRTVVLM